MEKTQSTVDVAGRKIHEIRGGSGRPLLYLHSGAGEAEWMVPHLGLLADHFELYAPAHPGFLGSEGIDEVSSVEDLVYHYLSYFDAKGWDEIDVVGLSLGGWIAAEIAARYPERVKRLMLTSAVGIWIRESPILDVFALDTRFPDRLAGMMFFDTDCAAARLMSLPPTELPEALLTRAAEHYAALAKLGWNPLLHDPKLEGLLGRVTASTLCLWGEHDRVVPVAYGEKFARLIPNARLEVVPRSGHLLPIEQPQAFVDHARAFFA